MGGQSNRRRVGQYELLEEIGSGGLGTVYRAVHCLVGREDAVKVLRCTLAEDPEFVARLKRQAQVMADLQHDRIVRLYGMDWSAGQHYLAMEYVCGPDGRPESLRDRLAGSPHGQIGQELVYRWACQVAEALAFAHSRGVVHQDIKPANILIDAKGDVKLTDFDLAKVVGDGSISKLLESVAKSLSEEPTESLERPDAMSANGQQTGSRPPGSVSAARTVARHAERILGTYDYMAPEQRGEGGRIDPTTDIYAVGVLLYRLLTGRRPVGITEMPSRLVPALGTRWDAILTKCLAYVQADRYRSAEELLADLRDRASAVETLELDCAGTPICLVRIPPGEFMMGSDDTDDMAGPEERPRHGARITRAFYLGVYPVTQNQYQRVMGTDPCDFRDPESPVHNVNWHEAREFCDRLACHTGRTVRLPTEAEWEYAARAGSNGRYCYGDDPDGLRDYAWTAADCHTGPRRVGRKRPNPWGLHDAHGNVWEWCSDLHQEDYFASAEREDPAGAKYGRCRVIKGGSWNQNAQRCRSAARGRQDPDVRSYAIGFRIVVAAE